MYRVLLFVIGSFSIVASGCGATGEELRLEARTRALEADELVAFLLQASEESLGTPRGDVVARKLVLVEALPMGDFRGRATAAGWSQAAETTWLRCQRLESGSADGPNADLVLQVDLATGSDGGIHTVQLLIDGFWPAGLPVVPCV